MKKSIKMFSKKINTVQGIAKLMDGKWDFFNGRNMIE